MVLPFNSILEARQELDRFLQAAAQGDPNAVNTKPRELTGVGDRAVFFGSFVYVLKGQTLYTLGANQSGSAEEREALIPLATAVAAQLPG